MCDLTDDQTQFLLGPKHTEVFEAAKQKIVKVPTLTYYKPKKETILQTNALDYRGLAMLLQTGKAVMYAPSPHGIMN